LPLFWYVSNIRGKPGFYKHYGHSIFLLIPGKPGDFTYLGLPGIVLGKSLVYQMTIEKKRDSATGLFLPMGDEPLERKPLAIKVSASLRERIQKIPNWPDWARKVLNEAAQRELLNQDEEAKP
jgi:hypothetical protein